ncbi:MAG: hypothetical protein ACRC6E_03925 [Fusobacteriaceae bacterium]
MKKIGLKENGLLSGFDVVVVDSFYNDIIEVEKIVKKLIEIEIEKFVIKFVTKERFCIDFYFSNGKINKVLKNDWVKNDKVEIYRKMLKLKGEN